LPEEKGRENEESDKKWGEDTSGTPSDDWGLRESENEKDNGGCEGMISQGSYLR
jgi:hypothetical protein